MANPKVTAQADVDALLAEIERLKGALVQKSSENEEVVRRAMMIAQDNEEVPTGKFVKVNGVDVPTFQYKIDMPPVGGVDIKLNGQSYQHGEVYTFDLHTLRTVKDAVFRLRAHEAAIHSDQENAYRKPLHTRLSGKNMGRAH